MIVGIDLGTTNSLVGVWRDGAVSLIPNSLGHLLTPSAVGAGEDGSILVGLAARERLVTHPALTAATFKRYMGTDRLIFVGEKGYRPEELSALVLRSLKADAEAFLGEPVEEAIITVPAYFNDIQRKATKAAGTLAGLKVERLLTEPTAAALAYGLNADDPDELILVVDLGGGTFDVSLLHRFEGVVEVRATAGDSRLGGEDFVDAIVAAFMAGPGGAAGLPTADAPIVGALRRQAELAKRALSNQDRTTISVVHGQADRVDDLARPVRPAERAAAGTAARADGAGAARRAGRSRPAHAHHSRRRRVADAVVPPADRAAVPPSPGLSGQS
jgi:molecular chaperone HscC